VAAKGFEESVIWPPNPGTYGEGNSVATSNLQRMNENAEEPTTVIPVLTDDCLFQLGHVKVRLWAQSLGILLHEILIRIQNLF
jgi:hypothetical protein